ncbi:MAG: right-handed parallel beta-helix repeat-containing protein [Anaerolineales bacterium]|nr:right-handed parallel beta-helix repeat-containing protein [Anaerolineales bacterium]
MSFQKHAWLPLCIALVVVSQLLLPAGVRAQEGDPPPQVTPTEIPPEPEGGTGESEEPPVTGAEQSLSVPEALDLLPQGTGIVVLNAEGQTEPLATQEAASLVASGVAWWCPAGVAPGGAGCTPPEDSLTDLVGLLGGGAYSGDGTIYIADAYTGLGDGPVITLDNSALFALDALTVQGGWNVGAGVVSGVTVFDGQSLEIVWNDDLTLNDLLFYEPSAVGVLVEAPLGGTVAVNDVTVVGGELTATGVTVINFSGDILVDDLTVSGSEVGAILFGGLESDLQVSNSQFNGNGDGLIVMQLPFADLPAGGAEEVAFPAAGTITLSNVVASNNAFGGAILYATGDVTVTDSSFSNNGWTGGDLADGLDIAMFLPGNVQLVYVDASNNRGSGVGVMAFGGGIPVGVGAAAGGLVPPVDGTTVTVVCGTFNDNGDVGFYLVEGDADTTTVNFIDVETNGNAYGPYDVGSATLVAMVLDSCDEALPGQDLPVQALPLHWVEVLGGEPVGLDCVHYSGTALRLPVGDRVIFYCPASGTASLAPRPFDDLPGVLAPGLTYLSGLSAGLDNGGPVTILPGGQVNVAFQVPEGASPADLAILYWDGSAWVDLEAEAVRLEPGRLVLGAPRATARGTFAVTVNFTGTFVLVQK